MAMLTPDESRQTDRKRVLKGAKISYAARCASLPCVVRDISSTGARLQVKDHGSVPETFELLIELDGFEAEVEVVWRRQGEVGVIFLDEPIVKNPKRRQVVSSSVPKARGTLRRIKATGSRRGNTVQQSVAEAAPVAPQEQVEPQPIETDELANDLVSVDDQVDALTTSLHTLEIVAGEDVVPTEVQAPQDEDQSVEANAPAETALESDIVALDKVTDATSSDEPTGEPRSLTLADDEPEQACAEDDASAACENAPVMHEQPKNAPSSETEDPAHAPQSPIDDTQDAPTMDQTFSPLACDTTTDASDDTVVETEATTDDSRDEAAMAAWAEDTERREVPMFRDPSDDTNVSMIMPQTVGEPTEALQATQDVVAPTTAEVATAQPVAAPLQSRIETALQAPARAADNLVQPLTPIVPAPTASAPTEDTPSAPEPVLATDTEMVAPALETETDTSVDSSSAPMRPELAAFVSMFAAPQSQETVASEATVAESSDELPVEDSGAEDEVAEMPAASEAAGMPRVDNVLAFASAASERAQDPQFDTAPAIAIVEDAIVIETAPTDAPEPTFCEMQVATSVEPEALDTPAEPTEFEELLPCADEDDYVAPVAVEADVLQVADVDTAESVALDTPSADTSDSEVKSVAAVAVTDEETAAAATPTEVAAAPVTSANTEAPRTAPATAQNIPILIAEDDADDRLFMREAFNDSEHHHEIAFVENGEELLAYLNGEGEYADCPRPGLILLDLNMPKMDGRTALLHIKANPSLRRIPVIVLTTSNSEDDIEKTYDLGVSSYISKPSSADGLKEIITTLNGYWSNLVALPTRH